jgi:peptidoglycan L-alanyl-D-glutamate endopeptidase CwlK
MSYVFGNSSKAKLKGVHPDLVKVMMTAIMNSGQDFSVVEGLRTVARQQMLFNKGKSQTMNSRHITGHAVDLLPYPFSGDVDGDGIPNVEDWDQYYPIADAVIAAAKEHNVAIRWGGNWRIGDTRLWNDSGKALAKAYPGTFPDGPHFELFREAYP